MTTPPSGNITSRFAVPRLPAGDRGRGFSATQTQRNANSPLSQPGYRVSSLRNFRIGQLARPENLYISFRKLEANGGHGAGIDGFRPEHYSKNELWPILKLLSRAITDASYRPYGVRICETPKPNGGTRELALLRWTDRVVAKALHDCLKGFWRGIHVSKSVWQVYAELHWAITRRRQYILASDDIRKCFDNARHDDVLGCIDQHVRRGKLYNLYERFIRSYNYHAEQGIGLAQGSPLSPTLMDVLLHHCLDQVIMTHSRNTLNLRYVDNLLYLNASVSEGRQVLSYAEETLSNAGFTLKHEDGNPRDLRDPTGNRVVLGLIPRWQSARLIPAIPESAYENLRQGLLMSNEADKPSENALLRCQGWLYSLGPALTRSDTGTVIDRVIEMALGAGYRNVTREGLRTVADEARTKWHRVLSGAR